MLSIMGVEKFPKQTMGGFGLEGRGLDRQI